ncbi:MAG: hypothetical protein LBV19_08230 [Streptococcaceae bacterium]|jgi:hypothetical protein|nr:hypothetical protein [Streptococcaceae bacterium]
MKNKSTEKQIIQTKRIVLALSIIYSALLSLSIFGIILLLNITFSNDVISYIAISYYFPASKYILWSLLLEIISVIIYWQAFRKIKGISGLGWGKALLVTGSVNLVLSVLIVDMFCTSVNLVVFVLCLLSYLKRRKIDEKTILELINQTEKKSINDKNSTKRKPINRKILAAICILAAIISLIGIDAGITHIFIKPEPKAMSKSEKEQIRDYERVVAKNVKKQFSGIEEIVFDGTSEDKNTGSWFSTFYITADWTRGHKNKDDYYFMSEGYTPEDYETQEYGIGVSTQFAEKHRGETDNPIIVRYSVGGKEKI